MRSQCLWEWFNHTHRKGWGTTQEILLRRRHSQVVVSVPKKAQVAQLVLPCELPPHRSICRTPDSSGWKQWVCASISSGHGARYSTGALGSSLCITDLKQKASHRIWCHWNYSEEPRVTFRDKRIVKGVFSCPYLVPNIAASRLFHWPWGLLLSPKISSDRDHKRSASWSSLSLYLTV